LHNSFLKITLLKSLIGRLPKHKATAVGLGLKKINRFVILKNSKPIAGMIKKIGYLVKVEKYEDKKCI